MIHQKSNKKGIFWALHSNQQYDFDRKNQSHRLNMITMDKIGVTEEEKLFLKGEKTCQNHEKFH